MFEHKRLQNLDEYFYSTSQRQSKITFFYRLNGYNEDIEKFIKKYYELARKNGSVIEGRISNPDERNLAYYYEIMGYDFRIDELFIENSLSKWLPRMNQTQKQYITMAMLDSFKSMYNSGKNENILKNTYVKFMCWLYYKFEQVVNKLGNEDLPKILYEGNISNYELKLLDILSKAGCDVLLLQYNGDNEYLKIDPENKFSEPYQVNGLINFPKDFNLKLIREKINNELKLKNVYGEIKYSQCTNNWIDKSQLNKAFENILKPTPLRGDNKDNFYNCFYILNGVEDKSTYSNELFQLQLQLKNSGRHIVIVENSIPNPTTDEIAEIKRGNYDSYDQMIITLSSNIKYNANIELQNLIVKAFIDVMLNFIKDEKKENLNLNKLLNKAVYILCWLNRYKQKLFVNWKINDIACFIYLNGCQNENEILLIKILSRLPIDILILNPNLNKNCYLNSNENLENVIQINNEFSMVVEKYPTENSSIQIGTVAYQAERELDEILYQNSGIYRNQQYNKANAVKLNTMYEEISILWEQEMKYRPNFSIIDDVVNMPTIFAKISGVKDGNINQYWRDIKALINEDTYLIKTPSDVLPTDNNPIKPFAIEFYKNGKLQKNKIKQHKAYQYSFLREDIQNYILDKLQLLIEQKIIKGTFVNGVEYTIVSTILNLKKEILRLIQKFDFTKKNPKLIYINTTENFISLEDSIIIAYLSLIGFDIIFFVPTGYQSIENHFNLKIMEEHQIGQYMYDLTVPNLDIIPNNKNNKHSFWRDKIFKYF